MAKYVRKLCSNLRNESFLMEITRVEKSKHYNLQKNFWNGNGNSRGNFNYFIFGNRNGMTPGKVKYTWNLFTLTTHPKILPCDFSCRFGQYIRHSKELDKLKRIVTKSAWFDDFKWNYEQLNFRWKICFCAVRG